jgi:hypothetical protein
MSQDFILEVLKIIASILIPYIALLRTRTDLDRFAAAQRAKELGTTVEEQLRKKWYHRIKKARTK